MGDGEDNRKSRLEVSAVELQLRAVTTHLGLHRLVPRGREVVISARGEPIDERTTPMDWDTHQAQIH
jgi:hypothetical protein